jgi:hypothetical protein
MPFPGTARATRRDFLNDYLQHQLVHVRVGGAASAAARSIGWKVPVYAPPKGADPFIR